MFAFGAVHGFLAQLKTISKEEGYLPEWTVWSLDSRASVLARRLVLLNTSLPLRTRYDAREQNSDGVSRMPGIWQSVMEHVLGWPVAALFLGLLFRKPLTELVGRINNIKAPGIEVAAPPAIAQIDAKVPISPPAALKGEIAPISTEPAIVPSAMTPLSPEILDEKRAAVRSFGHGLPMVDESVQSIKTELVGLDLPLASEDTAEILVRHLATTQLMVRCERTHRAIFGSQIVALHLMNNGGPQPDRALMSLFENARAQEPRFYGSYTFENWIGFLIGEAAVLKTDNSELSAITVYGRTYLEYIGAFATFPKPH